MLKPVSEVKKEEESFEVEEILNHKRVNNKDVYLVKWKNYDETYNEWTEAENFDDINA